MIGGELNMNEESQKFVGWMTGVRVEDYCGDCGALLHDTITMPDGSKRMVAHEIGSANCIENQNWAGSADVKELACICTGDFCTCE